MLQSQALSALLGSFGLTAFQKSPSGHIMKELNNTAGLTH